jgi:hypothetical protein
MHVFPCHKTARFEETEDGSTTEQVQHDNTQACAGALITMVKGEELGNLARIATRMGMFDPSILDLDSPTYNSLNEWSEAHNPEGDN